MRKALIAYAVLVVTAVGCGQASAPAPTARAPRRATVDPHVRSLLQHHTQRPPNVDAQFDFVGGAGPGACFELSKATRIRVYAEPFSATPFRPGDDVLHPGRATFGQSVDVCFDNFGPGPVDVRMAGPRRFTTTGVLHRLPPSDHYDSGWAGYDWVPAIDPSWPLGRYTVTAHSGTRHASASFALVAPTETGVRVLGPSTDPGHNTVPAASLAKVFLTGFRGARRVRLTVYRGEGMSTNASFFSSAQVEIPPSGSTLVKLATGRPSANTTFIVVVRYRGETLSAAFNVEALRPDPTTIVGPLPAS